MTAPALTQQQAWAEVDRCLENTGRFAYRTGTALVAAKEATPHGEWLPELKRRGISRQAAQSAMQVVNSMTEAEFLEHGSQRSALAALRPNDPHAGHLETNDTEVHSPAAQPQPTPETQPQPMFTGINPIASPEYHGQQLEPPPLVVPDSGPVPVDDRKRTPSRHHPAPYSEGLFPIFADLISSVAVERQQVKLLDPMCGEGSILDIKQHLPGVAFQVHASDLYRWTYAREGVHVADATSLPHPDSIFDVIVTSPPYGNRMADALSSDGDNRVTYADRRGAEAQPNDVSGMQWGQQYRLTMSTIWAETVRVAKPGALIVVNCKDHIRQARIQPVTEWHLLALTRLGCTITALRFLLTSGVKGIANDSARTGFETVFAVTTPDHTQPQPM